MAGMAAGTLPDILDAWGVDAGLVVVLGLDLELGSEARDSRSAGFPVTGSWAASRISCQRVQIGVGLRVCSLFAIKFPLAVGSSCSGYQSFGSAR
jgi:hypothetical protein